MPTPDVEIETVQAEIGEAQRRVERTEGRGTGASPEEAADRFQEMMMRDAWRRERLSAD